MPPSFSFAAVTAIAGASNTQHRPGIHNGVITTCVEPATKGNRTTSGDLNLLVCLKGARRISWNIRGPRGPSRSSGAGRGAGAQAPQGRRAPRGQQGRPEVLQVPLRCQLDTVLTRSTRRPAVPLLRPGGVYSTALGSPVADTTGGTFRFTCSAAQAPCFVAVKAAALQDSGGTVSLNPRLLLDRTGTPPGAPEPTLYCEYADGAGGGTGLKKSTKQPKSATPSYGAPQREHRRDSRLLARKPSGR